jgi:hypothetical protein
VSPASLLCASLGLVAHAPPGSNDATARVRFSAVVVPESDLALESHDLGGGLFAHTATLRRTHSTEPAIETLEAFAFAGDRVTFDATGERLVATRSNPRGLKEAYASR